MGERSKIVLMLLRVGLGLLFLWAGAIKAWNPTAFLVDIKHYDLLPHRLAVVLALYLPWLEISSGLALITKRL